MEPDTQEPKRLDDAIEELEVAVRANPSGSTEHLQLLLWLQELRGYRQGGGPEMRALEDIRSLCQTLTDEVRTALGGMRPRVETASRPGGP